MMSRSSFVGSSASSTRSKVTAYLRQLRLLVRTLLGEPRIRPLLLDVNREAAEFIGKYRAQDNALVARLREMRAEFVRVFPWADDSRTEKPEGQDPVFSAWGGTLAEFDEIASLPADSHEDRPITALGLEDSSRSRRLARILRAKLRALTPEFTARGQDAEVQTFGKRLDDLEDEQRYCHREFVNDRLTGAGTALDQLVQALNQMNRPVQVGRSWTTGELMQEAIRRWQAGDSQAEEIHQGRRRSTERRSSRDSGRPRNVSRRSCSCESESDARSSPYLSASGRDASGTTGIACGSSQQAPLVARRRCSPRRCPAGSSIKGSPPLSEPLTGGLQPDLLDPAKLYVEAKRYRDAQGSRDHIVRGMWQLHDTIARLKGTPHAVEEGFYVVFREAGPRYVLPASVAGEGWTVFPVLIDIAPLSASGSRQRQQPIEIPAAELAPRTHARG